MADQKLGALRDRLDEVDQKVVEALAERMKVVAEVASLKSSPQARRMPDKISRENRVRPSSEPPHLSSRVLENGVQNWSSRQ